MKSQSNQYPPGGDIFSFESIEASAAGWVGVNLVIYGLVQ